MKYFKFIIIALLAIAFSSCKSYKSNIILNAEQSDVNWKDTISKVIVQYPIKVGDRIQFSIFTNLGESIIDPAGNLVAAPVTYGDENSNNIAKPSYEVLEDGSCFFPVVGKLVVNGLRTSQLDSVLSSKFESYYNGVFVISKVINKKVIVIGGKGGQIIPFTSNMNLIEVLAIYGGLDDKSKGYNIRIIRGDLKSPEVTVVNLSTIKDMKRTVVSLKPDDIIYIEPVRRPGSESIRDNLYFFNIIQVIITTTILFRTL
ncbi:MAG: polysaccharide biosynthesis/export family protein [Bacteroidia bacterium]|nr:polysaccharide biosynthesis/export family protein [Bacteroidia bacterium]